MSGLYIHIPFCASACPYCDFAFVVRKTDLAERYVDAVCTELETRVDDIGSRTVLNTIYFGGGTPSAVEAKLLRRILAATREQFTVADDAEITLEANPNDWRRFRDMARIGITRLSLGVQALHDRALKSLGRIHNAREAVTAFENARSAGFRNINIDLIFGAPNQSAAEWQSTLERAVALGAEHMSVYGLTLEQGTPFYRRQRKGTLSIPTDDGQAGMFESTLDILGNAGYEHYEISNHARPGYRSRHNTGCWRGEPYLGLGMGAHSFSGATRSWNNDILETYLEKVESSGHAVEGNEAISDDQRSLERVLLGLRTIEGVPNDLLCRTAEPGMLQDLMERRLVERSGTDVRLTRSGRLVADAVCEALVGAL